VDNNVYFTGGGGGVYCIFNKLLKRLNQVSFVYNSL
jgi:hypothetical protein